MRIIHQDGFNHQARMEYRAAIHSNLVESAHSLVLAMKNLGVEPEGQCSQVSLFPLFFLFLREFLILGNKYVLQEDAEKILLFDLEKASEDPLFSFPQDIALAIFNLWQDPAITNMMDMYSSHFYLMDSAS
jgi:guanine nucleotide-binding protein G(i) subunit alpha